MNVVKLKIETIDKVMNYIANDVFIFTLKYKKKLGKNEFHNPGVARIIFESGNKKFNLLFMELMIETDQSGNITIRTMNQWKKIIQEVPYYKFLELKKAQKLFIIYRIKGLEYLEPEEVFEYAWAKSIFEMFKVQNLKIPYHIGGGF